MRRPDRLTCFAVFITSVGLPGSTYAAEATATMRVQAEFSSRTALEVSGRSLEFEIAEAAHTATAPVDFSAAARTHAGADVVLSVEVLPTAATAGDQSGFTVAGIGDGVLGGDLRPGTPFVAARWSGSGRRSGSFVFRMRAAVAGNYTVPVHFVLTAP
jgi:hypothetical protein